MNISILGCGWLGIPLAKALLKENHSLKGSTTQQEKMQELRAAGITPYVIKLMKEGIQGDLNAFLNAQDILIIDIPPGLRSNPEAGFAGKMERLVPYIEKARLKRVIFVSSTSVYKDAGHFPKYSEADAPNGTSNAAKQLISVEKRLAENDQFSTAIVRFGGLLGAGRHPVNYLAGKTGVKNPQAPVNLIQQPDCIEILLKIVEKDAFGAIFNAVYSNHPCKENYYTEKAKEKNLKPPEFDQNRPSEGKIIQSKNIKEILRMELKEGV